MSKDWVITLLQATAVTVALAAVMQELEKPREERQWHGKLGFIPYDFRPPTVERLKEAYWNADNPHIFTPEAWGIGWAINVHALLEKLRIISESYLTEDDFLMPTESLRKVLENRPLPQ